MVTPAESLLTQVHHKSQVDIRRAALGDILKLWPVWTLDDEIDSSWDRFMVAALAVEERYHRLSAARSGAYYSTARLLAGQPGDFQAEHATFDRDKAIASLMLLGLIMTKKQLALNKPNAKDVAFVRVSAAITAAVLSGGRDTLISATEKDPRATGFVRIITGTCDWCRQLAAWGKNVGAFQAHSNCVCVPSPAFGPGAAYYVNPEHRVAVKADVPRQEWDAKTAEVLGFEGPGAVDNMQEEAVANWQRWLDEGELRIQVPGEDVLIEILEDGRFKSQFESGDSMGLFDKGTRARVEERLFGYRDAPISRRIPGTPDSSRPIYGYVAQEGTYVDGVESYGDIRVTIKSTSRRKTTVTMGDSLTGGGNTMGASAIDDLDYSSFSPVGIQRHSYTDPNSTISVSRFHGGLVDEVVTAPGGYGYVEAQYHGGLNVSDIEFVWFVDEPQEDTIALMDKLGIDWKIDVDAPDSAFGPSFDDFDLASEGFDTAEEYEEFLDDLGFPGA